VAFGLVDQARSLNLVNAFAAAQPNWALPATSALFDNGSQQSVGYWPLAGLAFRGVGLNAIAASAATSIRTAALATNRAWPFTTGNAGQLILLESFTIPTWLGLPTTTTTAKATTTTSKKKANTRKKTTTTTAKATTTTVKPTTTTVRTTTTTTTTTLLPIPLPGSVL
jgi:hypothetical protein